MLSTKKRKADRLPLHTTCRGPIGSFRSPTTEWADQMAFLPNRKRDSGPGSSRRLQSNSTPRSSLRSGQKESPYPLLKPPLQSQRINWKLSFDSEARSAASHLRHGANCSKTARALPLRLFAFLEVKAA